MRTRFTETQRFTQWWIWLILIGIAGLIFFGIYKQLFLGEKFGNNPASDVGLILIALLVFALIGLFLVMRLQTEIDQKEIRFRFIPFIKENIAWRDILAAEIVNYGFVGGWGIRVWTKYGRIYNVKGNKGLAITLKSGKRLMIGTQKEAELGAVVKTCL